MSSVTDKMKQPMKDGGKSPYRDDKKCHICGDKTDKNLKVISHGKYICVKCETTAKR
uniref:Uncharacterized protein n=1 Tax=viral metagenome TaxID=1070528 RepID=A0A6M3L0M0_9ZZZZ